jgi:hypothetical protein
MYNFSQERLRDVARYMAGECGVEKTPEEWEADFRELIESYREAARRAGRLSIAELPDEEIWERIRGLCLDLDHTFPG